jgi:hypothetical protein
MLHMLLHDAVTLPVAAHEYSICSYFRGLYMIPWRALLDGPLHGVAVLFYFWPRVCRSLSNERPVRARPHQTLYCVHAGPVLLSLLVALSALRNTRVAYCMLSLRLCVC